MNFHHQNYPKSHTISKCIESITLYKAQSKMVKGRTFRENKKQEEDIFKEIDHEAKEYDINGNLGIMYFQSFKFLLFGKLSFFKFVSSLGGWMLKI